MTELNPNSTSCFDFTASTQASGAGEKHRSLDPVMSTRAEFPPLGDAQSEHGVRHDTSFAQLTTIGVGGPIADLVDVSTREDFIAAVSEADDARVPLFMLGGGSNVLASDAEFTGRVVRDVRNQIEVLAEDSCGGARFRVTAGTPWDEVVVFAIENGWMGLEALSGIPGVAGASTVQNIGAYGQDVSGAVASVRTFDRQTKQQRTIFCTDFQFGYRHSILKESILSGKWGASPRWIVLDVDFHLVRATLSEPIRYAQLAEKLDCKVGDRVPSTLVREAVLELRKSKGMVLDAVDRDTFSLGSFFTNPVLSADEARLLPPEAPQFTVSDGASTNLIGAAAPTQAGQVKTSAAWLIAHAGFEPGFGVSATASLSTKHTLALTNRGGASSQDIVELARTIQDGVRDAFGVTLVPEPVSLGLDWTHQR